MNILEQYYLDQLGKERGHTVCSKGTKEAGQEASSTKGISGSSYFFVRRFGSFEGGELEVVLGIYAIDHEVVLRVRLSSS